MHSLVFQYFRIVRTGEMQVRWKGEGCVEIQGGLIPSIHMLSSKFYIIKACIRPLPYFLALLLYVKSERNHLLSPFFISSSIVPH